METHLEHAEDPAARAADFHAVVEDPTRLRSWLQDALPVVYGFAFARCGGDQAVAEDITQETMIEVVKHRDAFDGRSHPTTWVCGIARHKVADHYRAQYREARRRLRVLEALPTIRQADNEVGDDREAVVEALHQLPEAQRVVLASHYLDGFSVREIAAQMDRSESAVESLLARGRDGFRRAWDQLQGEAT